MFFRIPNHKKRPEPQTRAQKVRELEMLKRERMKLFMMGHSIPRHMTERINKLAEETE